MPEGVIILDMSSIIGIFVLVAYILFFVGLTMKIKQGREKEKILRQLDEQLQDKYSPKDNN